MLFDFRNAKKKIKSIIKLETGHGRRHPVYRFLDADGSYVCEVRYGGRTANALQRGLWTHTKNAANHFNSLTGGWIEYSLNFTLVTLISHALVSSRQGHSSALEIIAEDIERLCRSEHVGSS